MPKFLGISGDNDAFVIRHIHIDAFIDRGMKMMNVNIRQI